MTKRIFLIVLDSLGIGNAPDAESFGDGGTNTLKRISESSAFSVPTLASLGLSCIDGVDYIEGRNASAKVARLIEASQGKDTTTGHWEIAGIVSDKPMPTYPDGFPEEIIKKLETATGRRVICNKPYSGTDVIRDYGDEQVKCGGLIVYTSADSVFQIAAHEDVIPIDELYGICDVARNILVGEHAVGRVIARPFIGVSGAYKRTANRRDFSLTPPRETMLDAISESGLEVISVGKIRDIFAGQGVTKAIPTHSNAEGMECTLRLAKSEFSGLCFVNLVDFDSNYGHRQDTDGYAKALSDFDGWLLGFLPELSDSDLLIITADHGCDPGDDSTDHTRECVPLIIYGKGLKGGNLGTYFGFGHVAATVCDALGIDFISEVGKSLLPEIFREDVLR